MTNIWLDKDYLKQSKWILEQDTTPFCPWNVMCYNCVVEHYKTGKKGVCSYTDRINAAKQYLRNEKLKKI